MKTVPYLYAEKEEKTNLSSKKAETNGEKLKELNGHKPEFIDLFNQNSPFRFMKIHTTLMEKEGINRNDVVVIDPGQIPITGKIVVVKIDDTFLIRRYEKMKHGFFLHADDQKISPLTIEPEYHNVDIIGVVTFIIKSL